MTVLEPPPRPSHDAEGVSVTRRRPLVLGFGLGGPVKHVLSVDLRAEQAEEAGAAVAVFTFFASGGSPIAAPYQGFSTSKNYPAFRYLAVSGAGDAEPQRLEFTPPPAAVSVEVAIHAWRLREVRACGEALVAPKVRPTGKAAAKVFRPTAAASMVAACTPGRGLRIRGAFTATDPQGRGVVLSLQFYTKAGQRLAARPTGYAQSDPGGSYRYLTAGPEPTDVPVDVFVTAPNGASTLSVRVMRWRPSAEIDVVEPLSVEPCDWGRYIADVDLARSAKTDLRYVAEQAGEAGDLAAALAAVERIWVRGGRESDGRRLRILQGVTRELDTAWLPRAGPAGGSAEPDPASILHLFKVLYPQESSGGAVRNWNIVRAQARAGLAPVACLSVQAEALADPLGAQAAREGVVDLQRDGVRVVYTRLSAADRGAVPPDALLEVEAVLAAETARRRRCGLVHAASGFKGFENALKGLAVARALDLPMVYEVRSFHEHTWGALRPGVLDAPLTRRRAAQEERCMAEADAVVTISEAMVRELSARGVPEDKIFVVPNAVDDHFLAPPDPAAVEALRRAYGLGDRKVVGYVSNMSRREGHEVLIRGFARAAESRPDLVLLLAGDGPMRAKLEQAAETDGVADRVVFTGVVDHAAIREVYALIDVFVVPRLADYASDHVTPLKPFEAMALGKRLIMSDRPVAREVIGDETRGWSFRTGDVDDLAEVLDRVLTDEDEAARRAELGRVWVREERTWRRNTEVYETVYAYARRAHAARRKAVAP